ncbi:acyl carrier protein [Wenjunlia vitaminophila]|uniref:Acyl carrier protein n=1 Tax=Wenjunlia vitaminophila TaxID=76728 RepID=A0A0T6LL09_WENVI|nr:acyl carrier protein [Wenjunlia vitaminophila]KRV46524.1 acyl carrier protein [Wenjunlia vitaminophila]
MAAINDKDAILEGLAEIVNEIAGIPAEEVELDKSFTDDLDVDSLSMVEVVVAAEERFEVKIPDDDVKGLRTVGDAADYILNAQLSTQS